MKKVKFIMAFLLLALPMFAQDVKPLNDDGVYEIIEVVNVDGVNVENLYLRAIEHCIVHKPPFIFRKSGRR